MRTVKPRDIFNLLPEPQPEPLYVMLPMPRGENPLGITLLETFLLIAMARFLKARRVFEIGTYHGATARALSLNQPEMAVVTLDRRQTADFAGSPNITALECDSRDFCPVQAFARLHSAFELVFVDGGHDPETFSRDSILAQELCSDSGVIVWHDCGNPDTPHIEETLQHVKGAVRIESTQLAVLGLPL